MLEKTGLTKNKMYTEKKLKKMKLLIRRKYNEEMAGNRRPYTGYGHMGRGFVASDMALESMKPFSNL